MPARIVFIGGTGRSGTNVLKDALSRHGEVAALPFEHRFTIDPDGLVDFYVSVTQAWSPFVVDEKLARLEALLRDMSEVSAGRYADWELERWFPGYGEHVAALIEELTAFTYEARWPGSQRERMRFVAPDRDAEIAATLGRFIDRCVGAVLSRDGKSIFVEDNTMNMLFAPQLAALVPSGRFIHCVRDPRDVVASYVGQRWLPGDVEQAVAYYRGAMGRIQSALAGVSEEALHVVRLEDLVENPEATLREVAAFVGVDDEPVMMEAVSRDAAHTGRWRTELDASQREMLEERLGDLTESLGYA